jgi:Family of unknown function (DUF6074)
VTATVFPFPLARRCAMIARQSRYAAELNPDSAERFIQHQLKTQGENMRRRGIDEILISRELYCMEIEIRSRLHRSVTGGAR